MQWAVVESWVTVHGHRVTFIIVFDLTLGLTYRFWQLPVPANSRSVFKRCQRMRVRKRASFAIRLLDLKTRTSIWDHVLQTWIKHSFDPPTVLVKIWYCWNWWANVNLFYKGPRHSWIKQWLFYTYDSNGNMNYGPSLQTAWTIYCHYIEKYLK